MKSRLGVLVLGSTTLWAALFLPARALWGQETTVYSAVAATICLLPAAATLLWGESASRGSAEQQLLMVVGGTSLRMTVAMGLGLAFYLWVQPPYFQSSGFWVWVLVFYLFTLGLEMVLLIRRSGAPQS